jgi:hypothetical protein
MGEPPPPELPGSVEVLANNLRVDAATGEVFRALADAGIATIVLKGPAIARWLYGPSEPRFYGDCDLLLASSDLTAASRTLERLGFVARHDPRAPDWGREHAREFERELDRVVVDLHTTLPGVGVDDATAWRELSAETESTTVGRTQVSVLSATGRTLHVSLHRAQHGIQWKRPLEDLERAIATGDAATWTEAADLACRLGATESFAAGLRLTEAGRELAARLDLPRGESLEAALRAATAPPVALGLEALRTASWRERGRLSLRKLFPPPAFMRRWRPIARRGALGLAIAYVYRPIWLLRLAPEGFRAWKEARRVVRRGS